MDIRIDKLYAQIEELQKKIYIKDDRIRMLEQKTKRLEYKLNDSEEEENTELKNTCDDYNNLMRESIFDQ